jgi:queuosine precursor transporter
VDTSREARAVSYSPLASTSSPAHPSASRGLDVVRTSAERSLGDYRYLVLLLVLAVAFQLICDVTAGKIILLFGVGVSVTVLYFPAVYILSDLITEVYGYVHARRVMWYSLFASMLACLVYQLVVFVPPAPFFAEPNKAYATVFGIVPRVLLGSWLAVFSGDVVNNYVLAKMKLLTQGRWLWTRTIGSTLVAQLINTAVFYVVALSGILAGTELIRAIVVGWLAKTAVEVVMTPVTYLAVNRLKRAEGVDVFDQGTNFNPFRV